ncbi:MAG: hypothetical protein Q9157_008655 [Trypethelium eluteriae]
MAELTPDEPPPSYEDSQAQAQAQAPEQSFQNLSLQDHSHQPQISSRNPFNDANSRRHGSSNRIDQPATSRHPRSHINATLSNPAQPSSALLEYALRFTRLQSFSQPSLSASRLNQPIVMPSLPATSPSHSFPVVKPASLPQLPSRIFHTFITNLNILLSLSAADPISTASISEPLVHTYISRINSTLFHPQYLHVSLVPTPDLAGTLLHRDPSYIETSRVLSAQAAVLSRQPVRSLESWADVVEPSISILSPSSPPVSSPFTPNTPHSNEKDNPETAELLRLRNEVLSERKAAAQLASEFNSASSSAIRASLASPPQQAFNTWTEWNTGDRHVDHGLLEAPPHSTSSGSKSNKSKGKSKSRFKSKSARDHDAEYDSDSSVSSVSSSSSTSSSDDSDRDTHRIGSSIGSSIGNSIGSSIGSSMIGSSSSSSSKHDRKHARREKKRARKFEWRLAKIGRRAERDLRRGKRDPETVRREKEEAVERLEGRMRRREAKRKGKGRAKGEEKETEEEKVVLWLVIQNGKRREGKTGVERAAPSSERSEYPREKDGPPA